MTKPGSTSDALVSNVDFAETFLDVAGLEIPDEMQGDSLVSLLKGKQPDDWRDSFYYQYYEYPRPHHVRPHYGVVTDRFKLIHFYGPDVDYWELFDREKDPHELRSVYNEAEYADVRQELEAEVKRLRAELKVPDVEDPAASGARPGPRQRARKKVQKTS